MEPVRNKGDIRSDILKRRIALGKEEVLNNSSLIVSRICSLREFVSAKTVLLYASVKGEPNIIPLINTATGKRFALPKVKGDELILYEVSKEDDLKSGAFGIPEPHGGKEISPDEVDLIAVPGIAFDREGYRLGWGKGYYDRLLKRAGAFKLGVAHSFQVLERLPRDPWDVPVDAVVTEKELIRRL